MIDIKMLVCSEDPFANFLYIYWITLKADLEKALQGRQFNVASVQFAFHYAFESEEKVRQTFSAISQALSPRGLYFGTVSLPI